MRLAKTGHVQLRHANEIMKHAAVRKYTILSSSKKEISPTGHFWYLTRHHYHLYKVSPAITKPRGLAFIEKMIIKKVLKYKLLVPVPQNKHSEKVLSLTQLGFVGVIPGRKLQAMLEALTSLTAKKDLEI